MPAQVIDLADCHTALGSPLDGAITAVAEDVAATTSTSTLPSRTHQGATTSTPASVPSETARRCNASRTTGSMLRPRQLDQSPLA